MNLRIKFKKNDLMKFIGHLDMVRAWQKIFRRSGIPIAYSEGFNPHQVFSVAAPLAVGVTSDGEYLDLKLTVDSYSLEDVVSKVNQVCPTGIEIIEAIELVGKQTAGMAACYAATYEISFSPALYEALLPEERIVEFMSRDSIIVLKRNKKGKMNELDIKSGIFDFSIKDNKFYMMLATGSSLNIKPELVLKALFEAFDVDMDSHIEDYYYNVHRFDIFTSINPLRTLTQIVNE